MPTLPKIMQQLKKLGSAQTRKIYRNHGADENMFGVKMADLKKIAKTIRGEQQLALDLYGTGNSDAMYLAGLVIDGSQMTKRQLQDWARQASWYLISEHTVPSVAVQNKHAHSLAVAWLKSRTESVAACGWSTYANLVATLVDEELDIAEIKSLLRQIAGGIHDAPNRVRYTMNGFVISVGGYVKPLLSTAKTTARRIGKFHVDVGATSCKVPDAVTYIEKIRRMGRTGKKRT